MKISFSLILLIISLGFLTSCDDDSTNNIPGYISFEDNIYTSKVEFSGQGRIYYTASAYGYGDEITSIRWKAPDLEVKEKTIEVGSAHFNIDTKHLIPEFNEMAAYCSDSTPVVTFFPASRGIDPPLDATYSIKGKLISSSNEETTVFDISGELTIEATGYAPLTVTLPKLPTATAKLYSMEITSNYTISGETYTTITTSDFAQVYRCPIPGTPLYERIIRWGCSWIDASIEDLGQETENQLAQTLLMGMYNLEPLGYRYGPFPRPSDFVDRAGVFLDFPQSACGEMRGFYMALVESQGIDANWLWFWFNQPSSQEYSMYQTIMIPALGTNEMIWRYSDHIVVQVNGKVYDPTYLVSAESADEYEDYMFASFCYGEDESCGRSSSNWCTFPDGPQGICTENHTGEVEDESPPRFTGEDYH
jgi:hypothetical protein